ncbi:stage II sporulation protein E [Peptococcaceae bacterium 1198_IL3148]
MYNDIDVYPYRRNSEGSKEAGHKGGLGYDKNKKGIKSFFKKWSTLGRAFTGRWLLLYLTAFFLGRAVLMGELMPFGVAFVAAFIRVAGSDNLGPLICTCLGLATVINGPPLASGILAIIATYLLLRFGPDMESRQWYVIPGVVLITELIVKCSFVAYGGGLLYGYISVLFEAVFACILTIAFLHALPPLWRSTVPGRISGEAVFCMLLLFGGVIAGTGEMGIGNVSLRGIISNYVILLAALVGGVGLGAAAGAVVGVIPGLSYVVAPVIIGAYSFAGLIAGMLRSFGRIGVSMGFMLGNILLSIYITNYGSMVEVLLETGLATLMFCLMPHRWIETVTKILPTHQGIKMHRLPLAQTRIKEITADRIRDWSGVFDELANSFQQVSTTVEQSQEEQGLEKLFIEVGQKVCDGCALYRTCWEREFYSTYQQILDLLANVETYGNLKIDDLPNAMKKRCARLKEMTITLNCLYDNFKLNNYWQEKLLESRQLVSEQLKGVSNILVNMSRELEKDAEQFGEIETAIIKRLKKEGLPVLDIFTFHHANGAVEVGITRPACGGKLECQHKIAPLVSAITGQDLIVASSGCSLQQNNADICTFKLYSSLPFRVSVGTAGIAKGGGKLSGDCFKMLQLRDGKYAVIISDGMGVGHQAHKESSAVVNLLEKLLATGFEKNMAVKTVNSIMALRAPNETFATVDLAVVDLYTGRVDFIKVCAAPCFIVKKDSIAIVQANTLPVGILENIEVISQSRTMSDGDLLVMVSDGVLDSYQSNLAPEEWFANILEDLAPLEPQEIAEVIIQIIASSLGGEEKIPDDMTVMAIKLERV